MESGSRTTHFCPAFRPLAAFNATERAAPQDPPGREEKPSKFADANLNQKITYQGYKPLKVEKPLNKNHILVFLH